jgi:hypothetical protein
MSLREDEGYGKGFDNYQFFDVLNSSLIIPLTSYLTLKNTISICLLITYR